MAGRWNRFIGSGRSPSCSSRTSVTAEFGLKKVPPLIPPLMRVFSVLGTHYRSVVKEETQVFPGFHQASETQKDTCTNFGTEGCRFEPYRVHLFSRFENNTKTPKKTGLGARHSKSSFLKICFSDKSVTCVGSIVIRRCTDEVEVGLTLSMR